MCLEVIFKIGKAVIMLCVHACAQQRVCVCVYVQVSQYVNSLFLSALPPGIFFSTHLIILCYIQPLACSLFSASFSLQPLHTFHSLSPPPFFLCLCVFSFFYWQSCLVFNQSTLPSHSLCFFSLKFSITFLLSQTPGEVDIPVKRR